MYNMATSTRVEFMMRIKKPGIPFLKAIDLPVCNYVIALPEYQKWLREKVDIIKSLIPTLTSTASETLQPIISSFFTDDTWRIYNADSLASDIRKNPKSKPIVESFNNNQKVLILGIPYFLFHQNYTAETNKIINPESATNNNEYFFIIHINNKFYYVKIHSADVSNPIIFRGNVFIEKNITSSVSISGNDLVFNDDDKKLIEVGISEPFKISFNLVATDAVRLNEFIMAGNKVYTIWPCDLEFVDFKCAIPYMSLPQKKSYLKELFIFYYDVFNFNHYSNNNGFRIDALIKTNSQNSDVEIKNYDISDFIITSELESSKAFNKNIWYSTYHVFGFLTINPEDKYDFFNKMTSERTNLEILIHRYGLMCYYMFQQFQDRNNGFDYYMQWIIPHFFKDYFKDTKDQIRKIKDARKLARGPTTQSGGLYCELYRKYKTKYLHLLKYYDDANRHY